MAGTKWLRLGGVVKQLNGSSRTVAAVKGVKVLVHVIGLTCRCREGSIVVPKGSVAHRRVLWKFSSRGCRHGVGACILSCGSARSRSRSRVRPRSCTEGALDVILKWRRCFLQNVILYSDNLLASMSDRSAMEIKPYPVTTATTSASKNVNEARTVMACITKAQSVPKRILTISVS